MFRHELEQHEMRINIAPARSVERNIALSAGVHWAKDALRRIDNLTKAATAQFRRRKAEEKLTVTDDETPHPIHEQIHLGRICQLGGWSAILADFAFAVVAILTVLHLYAIPLALAVLLAFVGGAAITLSLALLIHAGIMFLAKRFGNPVESRERVKKWFIRPAFFFVVVAILSYLAIQRLDVETLLAVQPILAAVKFTGMVVFLFFGAGLLVAAEFFFWSRVQAVEYEGLCSKRQQIDSRLEQWEHQLAQCEGETLPEPLAGEGDMTHKAQARDVSPVSEPNGQSPTSRPEATLAAGMKTTVLLLAAVVLIGSSSCTKPPVVKTEVEKPQQRVVLNYVIDASGVLNVSALQEVGVNIQKSAASIVINQHVTELKVYWFGKNGWLPSERASLKFPERIRVGVEHGELGDFGQLRPDIKEAEKHRDDKALAEATEQISAQYRSQVENTLAALTPNILIPTANVQSPCTDLNGAFGRFAAAPLGDDSGHGRQIVLIVTDGRQNCGGKRQIELANVPPKSVTVVIVMVPGTENDGREDFELRREQFSAACPVCLIVPYWNEHLDKAVSEAINRSR